MDEHLALLDLAGVVRRSLHEHDRQRAVRALAELAGLLDVHVRREERGIFAALKAQGDFADAVLALEQEHLDLDSALVALDPDSDGFDDRIGRLFDELSVHIDKENLGIFPVAVVTLGATGWDIVGRAHEVTAGA